MDLRMAYQAKQRKINNFAISVADTISLAEDTSIYSSSREESILIAMTIACKIISGIYPVVLVTLPFANSIDDAYILRKDFDYYKWKRRDSFIFYEIAQGRVFACIDKKTNNIIQFYDQESILSRDYEIDIDAYIINLYNSLDDCKYNKIKGNLGRINIILDSTTDNVRSEKACNFVKRIQRILN